MLFKENFGPVKALHMGRNLLGILPPVMTVRCYAVDGLLIDTGLYSFWPAVREFCRKQKVNQVVLTHHHEDHSGNASHLQKEGFPVWASQQTVEMMDNGFAIHFYEKVIWGKAPRMKAAVLNDRIETEHHCFQIIDAPGHAADQVVLFEEKEGWLFSGDAFLADRVKIFRADEDFSQTIETIDRLLTLDFENLYCAHRPVMKTGKQALIRKLEYLLELEQNVKALSAQGLPVEEITRRTLGEEDWKMKYFTAGDVSKRNVINSILYGPKQRKAQPNTFVC